MRVRSGLVACLVNFNSGTNSSNSLRAVACALCETETDRGLPIIERATALTPYCHWPAMAGHACAVSAYGTSRPGGLLLPATAIHGSALILDPTPER